MTMRKDVDRKTNRVGNVKMSLSSASILTFITMGLIVSICVLIRLLPLRWGFYMSEFDPYFHFRVTSYIVKNGLGALATWHDNMGWYPFGRDIIKVAFPGLPITAASLHFFLNMVGVQIELFDLCVIFPIIMASLACIAIFFLGNLIGGREVGLLSAFFLALNSSYISRTSLGFFDDETIGVLGFIVMFYFFLRAIDREETFRNSVIYAVLSGVFLGYVSASWGAVRYPIDMIALYVFALIILKRYSRKLLTSYLITYLVGFLIAINVPKLGIRFLFESFNLPVYFVLLMMLFIELFQRFKEFKTRITLSSFLVGIIIVGLFTLSHFGVIVNPAGKFIGALNPAVRNPLIESVAEHKTSAWGSFYLDIGILILLIPLGIYFAIKEPTDKNIFLILFSGTSLYFAGSMIRLLLIAAPAMSLVSAYGLAKLLKPFFINLSEPQIISKSRRRLHLPRVGREYSLTAILVLFSLLAINFAVPQPRVYELSYSPTTIASASAPVRTSSTIPDWIETLEWMRDNLPKGSIVVSWWDYGYWITALGNQTTLVDNATLNMTQIQNVARIFLSNQTESLKLLKRYNATHIVIFTTFDDYARDVGWGDEGKWMWMARIAGLNEFDFGDYDNATGRWVWNSRGLNTTLVRLMNYGRMAKLGYPIEEPTYFKPVFLSSGTTIQTGNMNYHILVCVYEIKYPET